MKNGMMTEDERMEFQGYRKLPVILLHFRDGLEDEEPMSLNPIEAIGKKEPGLCRNY